MKKIFFLAVLIITTACSNESHTGPMTGTPVNGQPQAYIDLCNRTPESVLCPQDVPVTHANLNAHWCNICAEDNNQYTWCESLKCEDTSAVRSIEDTQTKSNVMTGRKVRLRADAYIKLCRDDPESLLCKKQ